MNDLSIPDDLKALVMWSSPEPATNVVPPGESNDRKPAETADTERVVCVAERRGRLIGALVPVPLIAYWVLTLVFSLHFSSGFVFAFLASAVLAVAAIRRSGRTGFYQVTPAGTLGEYLGRRHPDLSGLQRSRVRTPPASDFPEDKTVRSSKSRSTR
jgi:hypothetical protein